MRRYENGEEEHCLELWNRDGKGLKWNDSPCSFETFFVCEVQWRLSFSPSNDHISLCLLSCLLFILSFLSSARVCNRETKDDMANASLWETRYPMCVRAANKWRFRSIGLIIMFCGLCDAWVCESVCRWWCESIRIFLIGICNLGSVNRCGDDVILYTMKRKFYVRGALIRTLHLVDAEIKNEEKIRKCMDRKMLDWYMYCWYKKSVEKR